MKQTRKERPLSSRQLRFITGYMAHGHGTNAAIAAGYPEKSAYSKGSQLLRNVKVKAEIERRIELRRLEAEVTVHTLLADLKAVKDRCMQREMVLDHEGNPTGEWKFDSRGALKAIELMGKHIGMFREDTSPMKDVTPEILRQMKDEELKQLFRELLLGFKAQSEPNRIGAGRNPASIATEVQS